MQKLHQILIENTLSLSIASSGADLRLQPVRVSALLADAIEESNAAASDKAIRIQVEPLSEDIELNIDPRLMHSALTNIISNAVKFTHRGGVVTVRSRCEADGVRLDVQDGCGGLPDGASERMFAPFVQFGEDRTGYGLGLAIARQAVQAHGGSIRVHNHPGNGCTLSIELPIGCKRA